jgi:DNA invertase Pin-like site-specific DNA recombinase
VVIALYVRVSSDRQLTRSQEADLKAYAAMEEAKGNEVVWYREKKSGTTFDRPVWEKLEADLNAGKVNALVVWRLDRLGRTAGPMIELLDRLTAKGINFVSVREGFDLSTPAGKLLRTVLAGVAQYETEVRSERQRAGIEAAKAAGKKWGGRKKGDRYKLTPEKEEAAKRMYAEDKSVAEIARVLGLTRQTIYRALGLWERPKAEEQPEEGE